MKKNTDIYVAIDTDSFDNAKKIINQLDYKYCGVKIGKELFTCCGPEIVMWVKKEGFKVFLDLKFHDIPNTVMKACHAASKLNIDILNVHALGGKNMMLAAKSAITNYKTKLIGVTLLTSHQQDFLNEAGLQGSIEDCIKRLAISVAESGLDGIVCAASDIPNIREYLPKDFIFITPGIRFEKLSNDDQKRAASPVEAINFGSNALVIGRPITGATNPKDVLLKLYDQINS